MRDELVRVHLKGPEILVVALVCTDTAREARRIHNCMPTSAGLLAQAIGAGFGVAGLLAGSARINLQVTCDGPIKNLLVAADAEGTARGYVKNPAVNFLNPSGSTFDASGALGREGMLSVLRELKDGEFYRGSVALEHFDLARDLERYYKESEQLQTLVRLELTPEEGEPLGRVSAVFAQLLPDADPMGLTLLREAWDGKKRRASAKHARAMELAQALAHAIPGSDSDLLAEYPLAYNCGCSPERVLRAVMAMGREEIEDMLRTEGRAVATCAFCGTVYQVNEEQLRQMLAASEPEESGADGDEDD